jgi:signal transduction histidine kinase
MRAAHSTDVVDRRPAPTPPAPGPPPPRASGAFHAPRLATLLASHGQRHEVAADTRLGEVEEWLRLHPEHVGVLVYEGATFRNLLSRAELDRQMARPLFREVFARQPVRSVLAEWAVFPLELTDDTRIDAAIATALTREEAIRYEPLVVRAADGTRWLLDIQRLLHAQCSVLSDSLAEVARQRAELEALQQQLVGASRRAGMAEIAGNILHNVGNVLNSVGVSAQRMGELLQASRLPSLARAVALLDDHTGDLVGFLTGDERGRRLPEFLGRLTEQLSAERRELIDEAGGLRRRVEHIAQVIGSQKAYATGAVAAESFDLGELLIDAIVMSGLETEAGLTVERAWEGTLPLHTDKHLVLQILVNLLRNAKIAVRDSVGPERRVRVAAEAHADAVDPRVCVAITDTGVGIPPENLERIFQQGFTTRPDGQGLGLHNAANLAGQLGGHIHAASEGLGRGATFSVTLPLAPA